MKRHIPNLLTLLNLACGTVAIVFCLEGQWQWSVYLILAAAGFDFLDGFAARLLKAWSDTGKQLDSLADMVSFGVLPAVFIYTVFKQQFQVPGNDAFPGWLQWFMLGSVVLVPMFSAIRLARLIPRIREIPFFMGCLHRPMPCSGQGFSGRSWRTGFFSARP